jgi:hypothetical protein
VRSFSHRSSKTFPSGMLTVIPAVSVAMHASHCVGFVLGRKQRRLRYFARMAQSIVLLPICWPVNRVYVHEKRGTGLQEKSI